jgi:hypothetical protein
MAAVTWCLGAASGTALAGPAIISVTPSGVDDTAELQAALDACSAVTVPCRIEISAGIFHTDVLLVRDFHGAVVGAGAGVTTIRPLQGIPLRSTSVVFLAPPTIADPYPILMHFAGSSRVHLEGFTLNFPAAMQVSPWTIGTDLVTDTLVSAVMVSGGEADHATLRMTGVEITATKTGNPITFDSNVMNAVRFEGTLQAILGDPTGTAIPLGGGRFEATDVVIRRTGLGFALRDATGVDASITANDVSDTGLIAVFFADLGGSQVSVFNNQLASDLIGVQWLRGVRPSNQKSQLRVQDNTITINAEGDAILGPGDGIVFADLTALTDPVLGGAIDRALIRFNRITLGPDAFDTVFIAGDRGNVRVAHNTMSGPAIDAAVVVLESAGTFIQQNTYTGFSPAADVLLLESTTGCVVREAAGTSVVDLGSNNTIAFRN